MLNLEDIKGVGAQTLKKLNALGIYSAFQLFSFFPRKYINLQQPISVTEAKIGQLCLLEGRVEKVSSISSRGKRAFWVSFLDNLSNGKIHFKAMFYNMPFLHDSFEVGQNYRMLTRLANEEGAFIVVNPQLETLEKISKLDGIYTVYPLKNILGQNAFKNIVYSALDSIKSLEYNGALAKINKDFGTCFEKLHRPSDEEEAQNALIRLASIDLAITLSIYRKLRDNAKKQQKVFYNLPKSIILDYKNALPFTPTNTQEDAFCDIVNDLQSSKNMSRVVSGDVGSGKTLVAFFAAYCAFTQGYQCAIMVPTEILARQHFEKLEKIASRLGMKIACLTSSTSSNERKDILCRLANVEIDCIIGTQSIIGNEVKYAHLSMAIIDEQHKFGVNDRAKLEEKGACDVLSMTATPIPRSMALTFYDDIAISRIEKRADATTNVHTIIHDDLTSALNDLKQHCTEGKQAFIVCPSIEDAEGNTTNSIETFERDYIQYFDSFRVATIHGRLLNEQKQAVMDKFSSGEIDVLIATSVIEVGIDTKASAILILNAERFGLASLHQLRGRVGRDGSEAHCYLYVADASEKALDRLHAFSSTTDGQKLAEIDFSLRGAGNMFGSEQSGVSITPIFHLPMSAKALFDAKEYAKELENLSLESLTKLTRASKNTVDIFLAEIQKITLNS